MLHKDLIGTRTTESFQHLGCYLYRGLVATILCYLADGYHHLIVVVAVMICFVGDAPISRHHTYAYSKASRNIRGHLDDKRVATYAHGGRGTECRPLVRHTHNEVLELGLGRMHLSRRIFDELYGDELVCASLYKL